MALRIFTGVQRHEPVAGEAQTDVVQRASIAGTTGWIEKALQSLLMDPIQPDRELGYINGRHRAKAMLDAGVHRTLVARWVEARPGR
jgi:hypothetical protein